MFESLTDKLSQAFRHLRGNDKLTEKNIEDALQEVREALLAADVNYKIARQFVEDVKQQCLGEAIVRSVTPGQQFVKIVHDALTNLLGEGSPQLSEERPLRILLVGLHGSGKTTTSAKLAQTLKGAGYTPALIACDVYRPAAIDQLEALAKQQGFLCYTDRQNQNVSRIAQDGITWAEKSGADAFIIDTAGRLQIDTPLIEEIKQLKSKVMPQEVLLVADSALGQQAVDVVQHFNEAVALTGVVLTKLDGDARGGAALSMKAATGVSIKFAGIGEKINDLSRFYPERMAQRILGMGDVVSLVEKASATLEKEEAERLAKRFQDATFDLDDFLRQMQQMKKMGSFSTLAGMMPGLRGFNIGQQEDNLMKRTESIILSMTLQERHNPSLLNASSRRTRVAKGSGANIKEVNQVLKQYQQMRTVMLSMKGSKGKQMMRKMADFVMGGQNPFASS